PPCRRGASVRSPRPSSRERGMPPSTLARTVSSMARFAASAFEETQKAPVLGDGLLVVGLDPVPEALQVRDDLALGESEILPSRGDRGEAREAFCECLGQRRFQALPCRRRGVATDRPGGENPTGA